MPYLLRQRAYFGFAFAGLFLLCAIPAASAGENAPIKPAPGKLEAGAVNTGREASAKLASTPSINRLKQIVMEPKNPGEVLSLGEKLSYLIKYKGLPAGESVFSVKRKTRLGGKPVYYLTMETESNDAINLLYPVRDKVKSYISAETGFSLRFERSLREGSYKANDKLVYDYDKNEQTYTAIKYKGDTPREKIKPPRPIPGPLQDPLSAIYYLRHFPLKVGESKEILIGNRKHTDILVVTPTREEEITIPGIGVFDAYLVKLSSGDGQGKKYNSEIFFSEGEIKLWIEKHTNIPLMLRVGVPILGEMTAILQNAEGSALQDYIKREAE